MANVDQKLFSSAHWPNKCKQLIWIGLREYFFRSWSEITIFSHFWATRWPTFWPTLPKKRINSEHSPNKCRHQVELDCVDTYSGNGRKTPFWPILSYFLTTRGLEFDQCRPKANHFRNDSILGDIGQWTFTQQVYTKSLNWIVWTLFQIMVGNHHFDQFPVFLATRGPKLGQRRPKSESVLNTHPTNAYTEFEFNLSDYYSGKLSEIPDGRMHGCSPFLCPLLTLSARTITHSGLVTPYGDIVLGQHWLR